MAFAPRNTKQQVRQQRDRLIAQLAPLMERHMQQKAFALTATWTDLEARSVALYFQALRDVPQQPSFPSRILWPKVPEVLRNKIVS